MSWQAVARKDFEDAVRSRWLLGLTTLFTLLVSLAVYIVRPAGGGTFSSNAVLNSIVVKDGVTTTLIPLIALVMAYSAVVGERASGSLKLLLSLPHSRADVVFGKVLGRSGAIALPVVVGFLLPALLLALGPLNFAVGSYVGYTLLTAFLGCVFVGIAVGFSAAMASQRLAMAGAMGLYLLFVPLWGAVQFPLQIYLQLSGGVPGWLPLTGPEIFRLLRLLNPTGSFKIVSGAFLNGQLFTGGSANLHVAAATMLVGWLLLPPLLGLWKFERADL
ncbi:ABC-2 type transport system permease protein [Halogranum gelatinilyticum]|uniref:ABC-2 type transport system permease protein n=1 Tax=Halogranum gelatinilyticum TaxID=660521 RepID=A0A1G9NT81_9EURY|nr:ABC transporter permease subunit [Halogranum gelatinilyticum]SDL89798.1 ABC-2 type transport system permease protein [Halogranum gelatinilyticum]